MSRRYREREESSFEQGFGLTCGCLAALVCVFCLLPIGILTVGMIATQRERRPDTAPPTKKTEPTRPNEPAPKKDRKG